MAPVFKIGKPQSSSEIASGSSDAARIVGKLVDDAAAKCAPPSAQGRRRDRQAPDLVDRRPGPEVSAEENGLHRSGQPAGAGGNIAEGPAEVDLLKSRLPDGTGDGHQTGVGVDASGDLRRHGEALDVLDERWPPIDAPLEGPRRGRRRPGIAGVDEVNSR